MSKMSLEELKAAIEKRAGIVEVPCESLGGTVGMRRITAMTGLVLRKKWQAAEKNDDGSFVNDEERFELLIEIISAAIVDANGKQMLNNEEGRALLRTLGFEEITELGAAAMEVVGFTSPADPT